MGLFLIITNPKFLLINYKIVLFKLKKKNLSFYKITLNQIKYNWFKQLALRIFMGNFKFIQLNKKTLNFLKLFQLSNLKNHIIYQSIELILELIFEPSFSKNSYGFRPKKGCHLLLKQLKLYWPNFSWVLSFNVQKTFSTLNNKKLMNILLLKIKDSLFLKLIRQFLKINLNEVINFDIKTAVPILLNIYLNSLDLEILKVQQNLNLFNKSFKSNLNFKFFECKNFRTLNLLKYGSILTYKNKLLTNKIDKLYNTHLKLISFKYIRYLNSFLLGFNCSKTLIKKIEKYVTTFCNSNLKLVVLNSQLFSLKNKKIDFLNFEIFFKKSYFITKFKSNNFSNKKMQLSSINKNYIFIKVSLKIFKKYLIFNNIILNSFKPKVVTWLLMYSNDLIVLWFASLAKNILNYFCCCTNFYKIKIYVDFFIRYSALFTLALKNKLSLSQTINKWSKNLVIKDNQDKLIVVQYLNKSEIKNKKKMYSPDINVDLFNFNT